jgi:hypothetical protein
MRRLEQAWRQAFEGELQVLAQAIRIGELVSLRKDTTKAGAVFYALEDKQRLLASCARSWSWSRQKRHAAGHGSGDGFMVSSTAPARGW